MVVSRGAVGRAAVVARPGADAWLFELAEVFAHGVVAGQDGGVSVRGDPVDNGVSQDFLLDPVVPLARWQRGRFVHRRGAQVVLGEYWTEW